MANMGKYCKAYPVNRFREFNNWTANLQNLRQDKQQADGQETVAPRELTDDDHFYLQENFTVTDGIFIDENIVFGDVTPEWVEFCKNTLNFEIPVYEPINRVEEQASATNN
ncbi:MAG TPA: hypothetical protein VKA70_08690 [Blastocatellia bacterium]|nr:hypothetical protein [Blastocatellia bacterium]